jgi:hypothetical protein
MKIVQSFWSGNQTELTNNYGWYSYKHHWLSWILSCHLLVKYHNEVELYTDSFGYEILIKKLQLPYTKVHVVLDELNHYDKNLWAIAKVRTFQLQTEPFLHVDGDVFVWESLTDRFENSNIVSQNLEITTDYYRKGWEFIHKQLKFLPTEMNEYNENRSNLACNMGIIGGNNLDFFKHYTHKSIEFVMENATCIVGLESLNFNIFFEQVLFYEMTKIAKENIDFYFDEISLDNDYKGFGDFQKVPNKKYLHLLGDYKRNSIVCKAMEIYVMKYYPENFSMLAKLINEKNKNNIEIDFLSTQKITELLTEFDVELKSSFFKKEQYLLKRDLYNEGLPNKLDLFLNKDQNFWIVTIKGFERKTINDEEIKIDYLIIEESNCDSEIYDLDEIDEIILSETIKPIQYFDFIEKIKLYLDEDDEESITEFIFLINQTLRNYLTLKIISIYI